MLSGIQKGVPPQNLECLVTILKPKIRGGLLMPINTTREPISPARFILNTPQRFVPSVKLIYAAMIFS